MYHTFYVLYLQAIHTSVLSDALISVGGKNEPCVIADIQAFGVFDDAKNVVYAKPLMEFFMAKFNLPVERWFIGLHWMQYKYVLSIQGDAQK